tara:strand:- start:1606 stop:1848 length:243 start_codon:yes stop_codon:yes gene_type:complete
MTNLVEGMTTIVMKKDMMTKKQRENELQLLLVIFLMKVLTIALVSHFLWPRVMPKIFSGVQSNPGFLNVFGLSVILHLLV